MFTSLPRRALEQDVAVLSSVDTVLRRLVYDVTDPSIAPEPG